jgi:pSer/pThr/pTyr-binding forkhead associated (FHA) protein
MPPRIRTVWNKGTSIEDTLRLPSLLVECFRVSAPPEEGAWLEAANRKRHSIKDRCSLGRTAANMIVFESRKVSRRHALTHLQNIGEVWLIDLGSSNGIFLNKRQTHDPIRLSDGDQITIGDQVLRVHQPTFAASHHSIAEY